MSAASLGVRLRRVALRQSYAFALVLLVVTVAINYYLQPNFFQPGLLSGNLLLFVPLMLVAVGQTVVVIGGGIDLSLGAIVSMANVIIVTLMAQEPSSSRILLALGAGLGAGILAGALNGFCVAVLRFQPIVTTFATSFVFSGLALYVLPEPGGTMPPGLQGFYYSNPLGLPMVLWVVVVVLLLWNLLRSTRYGPYLYATGGRDLSAFVSGVPVSSVRFLSYCIAGLMAALAALALALSTGTGNPIGGTDLMLQSIVAVVLGGTRLSGGQGGVVGSIIGVVILSLIQSIVSFSPAPSSWQTLINGLIVVAALAGPGLFALLRRGVRSVKRIGLNPIVIALILAVILFAVGGIVQPGFASYGQAMNILRLAAFLGIVAAGQTLVIISGGEGIDLSVGAVITLGAILVFRIGDGQNDQALLALAIALGVGLLIGATNGLGITLLGIPPLVMTLGMTGVVQGLILVITGGRVEGGAAPALTGLVTNPLILGIPGVIFLWLLLGALMWALLRRTAYGRRLFAVGTNRVTAKLSGVRVPSVLVLTYALSGMLAALGGVVLLGYTEQVFLNLGDPYTLPSVAAVVVGGTLLAGGVGSYFGTMAGALVLTLLTSLLTALDLPESMRLIVYGATLLLLLSLYGRQKALRQ